MLTVLRGRVFAYVYFKWKHPCKYGRSIQGLLAKVEDNMLRAVCNFCDRGNMLEHFKGRKKSLFGAVVGNNSTGQLSIY